MKKQIVSTLLLSIIFLSSNAAPTMMLKTPKPTPYFEFKLNFDRLYDYELVPGFEFSTKNRQSFEFFAITRLQHDPVAPFNLVSNYNFDDIKSLNGASIGFKFNSKTKTYHLFEVPYLGRNYFKYFLTYKHQKTESGSEGSFFGNSTDFTDFSGDYYTGGIQVGMNRIFSRILFDMFTGIGISYRNFNYEGFDNNSLPVHFQKSLLSPVFNIGLNVGFEWGKERRGLSDSEE